MEETAASGASAREPQRIRGYLAGALCLATLLAVVCWHGQQVSTAEPSHHSPIDLLLFRTRASSFMSCGSAALCGVLALESGLGPGLYAHKDATVHGLWPQVPPYGTAKCIPPRSHVVPAHLPSCYKTQEATKDPKHEQEFVDHEWDKHGSCAGAVTAQNYFQQICNLSKEPLEVMQARLNVSHDIHDAVSALEQANFSVFEIDAEHGQILLSACAVPDSTGNYVWKLSAVKNFDSTCSSPGPSPPPGPGPAPPTPPVPESSCKVGVRGPSCKKDQDCKNLTGCIRCAHSGFCTDQPLPVVV